MVVTWLNTLCWLDKISIVNMFAACSMESCHWSRALLSWIFLCLYSAAHFYSPRSAIDLVHAKGDHYPPKKKVDLVNLDLPVISFVESFGGPVLRGWKRAANLWSQVMGQCEVQAQSGVTLLLLLIGHDYYYMCGTNLEDSQNKNL